MKVTTAQEMQDIDHKTIEEYGLAGIVLMERAGCATAARIKELYPPNSVSVVAGGGNNGGDGFVIARQLHNSGQSVKVFLFADPERLKGDALINYQAAQKFGVTIERKQKITPDEFEGSVVVDALLGTGLEKNVRPPLTEAIEAVNNSSSPVVSVDIPSGVSSDTGQVMGVAVKASSTVTFGLPKRGHFIYPGAQYRGKLFIEDIGFPASLKESDRITVELVEEKDISSLVRPRARDAHKGDFGHILLVAGSKGKTGAALMAARAALRTGVGLVTIGIPASLSDIFQSRVYEEMILPLPDNEGFFSTKALDPALEFIAAQANVLAVGPGVSTEPEVSEFVRLLVKEAAVPIVVDADGINAFAQEQSLRPYTSSPLIMTPHPGEMSRIAGLTAKEINSSRITVAQDYAQKNNLVLVLKGAPTVTAEPGGQVFINSTGNPGMASAGTGDVLTGIISALLAQGLSSSDAAKGGAYLHGLAGDCAAREKTEAALIAGDIIEKIPEVLKKWLLEQ
jgi:hydroxyethylthiazole kinase-like uncharacterized protein yjeF